MPTYCYLCEVVDEEFEEFHSITKQIEECPLCKEAGREDHKPKRLISGPSAGRVELSGRDYIAKVKEDAKAFKKEVYSSEKAYSNVVGSDTYQRIQQGLDKGRGNRR